MVKSPEDNPAVISVTMKASEVTKPSPPKIIFVGQKLIVRHTKSVTSGHVTVSIGKQ